MMVKLDVIGSNDISVEIYIYYVAGSCIGIYSG